MQTGVVRNRDIATLGGQLFPVSEAVYDDLMGVISVESGYMGGHTAKPSYKAVCGGDTGHAEVVQITFDPAVVSFQDILQVCFVIHDPTTLNRQGNDVGPQYRSAIFYHTPQQKAVAEAVMNNIERAKFREHFVDKLKRVRQTKG